MISNTPLSLYLSSWLRATQRRPNTQLCYDSTVRLYVVPHLGARPVSELSRAEVRAWVGTLGAAGKSPRVQQLALAVLRTALTPLVEDGVLPQNPAALRGVVVPAEREARALTPDQARLVRQAAVGTPLEAFVAVALATAARQGELLALHWEDVDLVTGAVRLHYNLLEQRGKILGRAPVKTRAGRRTVLLPGWALSALLNAPGAKAGPVFKGPDGGYWHKSTLHRAFKAVVRRAAGLGLNFGDGGATSSLRIHELRHTGATLMLQALPVNAVSRILGHSKTSTTVNYYGHSLPGDAARGAAVMAEVLG